MFSQSEPAGQIPELFAAISKTLSADLVKKTGAVYQFNVKGKQRNVLDVGKSLPYFYMALVVSW